MIQIHRQKRRTMCTHKPISVILSAVYINKYFIYTEDILSIYL